MTTNEPKASSRKIDLPTAEALQRELNSATSMDDFFGKDGIFARLFSKTLEQMLEGEMTAHVGYEKYAPEGRNKGNSRNGKYRRKVKSSAGEVSIEVPREACGDVPFGRGRSSRRSCTTTPPRVTNWKTKSSRCMHAG